MLNGVASTPSRCRSSATWTSATLGGPITLLGLVALMNVVNFSDGIDGLAAGVCAISAAAFSIIAFDLGTRRRAAILAAITCRRRARLPLHNFHPASVFMGDCGSNLLGPAARRR